MATEWDTPVGAMLSREDRAAKYGGSLYGGIEPSAKSRNVFVYSDRAQGEIYGYNFDGWDPDTELFLYTGEGTLGPQKMIEGNKAIVEHRKAGRTLRLFIAEGKLPGRSAKNHRYIGQFEIDEYVPYLERVAPDKAGNQRLVFVFRLRPVADYVRRDQDVTDLASTDTSAEADVVPLERSREDSYHTAGTAPGTARKRERALVVRYSKALEEAGHNVQRWRIKPPGQSVRLYTDLYDATANELYEAKGTATRDDVRMAIGQLFDYRRQVSAGVQLTVLLPYGPSADVLALIHSVGFTCVYGRSDGSFERRKPPTVNNR
jgi:hypothetical protein